MSHWFFLDQLCCSVLVLPLTRRTWVLWSTLSPLSTSFVRGILLQLGVNRLFLGRDGGRGLMSPPMQSQNSLAAVLQNSQFASLASRATAGDNVFFFFAKCAVNRSVFNVITFRCVPPWCCGFVTGFKANGLELKTPLKHH